MPPPRRPKLARTVSEPVICGIKRRTPSTTKRKGIGVLLQQSPEWRSLENMAASSLLMWCPFSSTRSLMEDELAPRSRRRRVSFAPDVCFLRKGRRLKEKSNPKLEMLTIEEIDLGSSASVPRTPFSSAETTSSDDEEQPDSCYWPKRRTQSNKASSSSSLQSLENRLRKVRRKLDVATHRIWLAKSHEEELRRQNSRIRQDLLRCAIYSRTSIIRT